MIAPDLFEFSYVPDWYGHLAELERLALPESWKFRKPSRETKNTDIPILERYIHTIFRKQVMDNVYVRQDPAGNIKMDKEKSNLRRKSMQQQPLWHLTVQFVIRAAREVYMMAGEFLFFKKENLSGRWRDLNDHGFVYVSE